LADQESVAVLAHLEYPAFRHIEHSIMLPQIQFSLRGPGLDKDPAHPLVEVNHHLLVILA